MTNKDYLALMSEITYDSSDTCHSCRGSGHGTHACFYVALKTRNPTPTCRCPLAFKLSTLHTKQSLYDDKKDYDLTHRNGLFYGHGVVK